MDSVYRTSTISVRESGGDSERSESDELIVAQRCGQASWLQNDKYQCHYLYRQNNLKQQQYSTGHTKGESWKSK